MIAPLLTLALAIADTPATTAPQPNAAATAPPSTPSSEYPSMAINLMSQMNTGQFKAIEDASTPAMKADLPAEKMSTVWASIQQQVGKYQEVVSTKEVDQSGYHVVVAVVKFENAVLDTTISYDSNGLLAGIYFKPHEDAAAAPSPAAAVPVPAGIEERSITVGQGTKWALPGTLTIPLGSGPFPIVVLVHGSGPNDRDETILGNKPFRDIAWGLAKHGIATIRYDKRTHIYAQQMVALGKLTVNDESIDDAVLAANLARTEPKIDPREVFVLGHSLGAYLMPRIAKRTTFAAGYILLAGLTEPLTDAFLDQVKARLAGHTDPASKAALKTVEAQVAAAKSPSLSTKTPSSDLPFGIPADYWLDLRGYNPARMARSIKQPMLFLQGADDFQVLPSDLGVWRSNLASKKNATYKLYPGLSHLFMAGQKTPDDYAKPAHVDGKVIADISAWIKGVDEK